MSYVSILIIKLDWDEKKLRNNNREIVEDSHKLREFREASSELREAMKLWDIYIEELKMWDSSDDVLGSIKIMRRMQLDDMEKASHLLLMERET
ncbi:hypothetical protein Tco_0087866 [Tanacetum coccineum]